MSDQGVHGAPHRLSWETGPPAEDGQDDQPLQSAAHRPTPARARLARIPSMTPIQKRLLGFVLAVGLLLLALALLYMGGMSWLEGEPRGFLQSLEWAAETLTTTGYGADASWSHPVMVVFVICVQLVGCWSSSSSSPST